MFFNQSYMYMLTTDFDNIILGGGKNPGATPLHLWNHEQHILNQFARCGLQTGLDSDLWSDLAHLHESSLS